MMKYKGFLGHVEYDDEAKLFHGEIVGLKDVITFQGTTVEELERSFRDSIEVYLSLCQERGEKPEKTFSGTFNLRINPDLHAKLSIRAKALGLSLNSYVAEKLKQ
jgi:predicted HicB family RNase H-like nuclease